MAQTYVPIQTYTLSSTSTSLVFTNIPQNYNDLLIKLSSRTTTPTSVGESIFISFNSSTSNFSNRTVYGSGSSVGAFTSEPRFVGTNNSGGSTANTFSTTEIYIPNYTLSNHKNYSLDSVVENNATEGYDYFGAGVWADTSAITTITLTTNSANAFAINTTATLYGIGGTRATGGTITADSQYTYHTFTSTGTFTTFENIKGAEVLLIAGGGGGGSESDSNSTGAGGGGAGGISYLAGQTLFAGNSYTAVVGGGGAAGGAGGANGSQGSNSQFSSVTNAVGGGKGGGTDGTGTNRNGGSGGSGGGAGSNGTSGTGTSGQGNDGGTVNNLNGAGGGGAGAVGGNASSTNGGNGGAGSSTYSAWGYATSTGQSSGGIFYYAGGGGAGYSTVTGGTTNGTGGLGGGGAGGNPGTAGTANTGGGGGGANSVGTNTSGGAGGSGLVIIRYPN